jgi:hypothetical protein
MLQFPFSHNTLMLLNIILAFVHIVLSSIFFYVYYKQVRVPSYAFPVFFVVSIIACLLILLYSYDCRNRFGDHKEI